MDPAAPATWRTALARLSPLAPFRKRFQNWWQARLPLNDTLLLTAGVTLAVLLQVSQAWLPVKLGLLVAYIVLGVFALRRARSWAGKALSFLLALLCVAQVFWIARLHHPLGLLKAVL